MVEGNVDSTTLLTPLENVTIKHYSTYRAPEREA
jgi:hypothetical protein